MRTTMTVLLAFLLLALPLRAEDEPRSAAEQAFEDAYWAETSKAALDHALLAYRAAADAEGPAEVRARALYRAAVVLERMGRTDEAIQTLERLEKEFPDETKFLAKAQERLAEWTAVDLRSAFDEWYERYQYSPEFQARVVETVLRLAGASNEEVRTIEQELLTIGDPVVPALRAHADSPNAVFRGRVVTLLLRLGAVPTAEQLASTSHWVRTQDAWRTLLTLPPQERAVLRAALPADAWEPLHLALGPTSDWPRAIMESQSTAVLRAALDAAPDDAVGRALLPLIDETGDSGFEFSLAQQLRRLGLVEDARILAWLKSPSQHLRTFAVDVITRDLADHPRTLGAVAEAMRAFPAHANRSQSGRHDYLKLAQALAASFTEAADPADRRGAVDALDATWETQGGLGRGALWQWNRSLGTTPPAITKEKVRRLYEAVADRAETGKLVEWAIREWMSEVEGGIPATRRLLSWGSAPEERPARDTATREAYKRVTDESLDLLLGALGELPADVVGDAWRGMGSSKQIERLSWTDERLAALMHRGRGVGSRADQVVAWILKGGRMPQLARVALDDPSAVLMEALPIVSVEQRSSAAVLDVLREGLDTAWETWTWKERKTAMALLGFLWRWTDVAKDAPVLAFLREQARAEWPPPSDVAAREAQGDVRLAILEALPTLTLEDVVQAFDVSTPEGAAAAVLALVPRGASPTLDAYERLAAFRRHPDEQRREAAYAWWMSADVDLLRRVRTDQLKDPSPRIRWGALRWLAGFRDPQDIPALIGALTDEDAGVRERAATWIGKNYDESAIDALVAALDDPAPQVRDAALEALEGIKAIEEKKAWWRERGER